MRKGVNQMLTKGRIKSQKHGFTLVELLITIALMSLVAVLAAQLSFTVHHRFAQLEARWKVQEAARRVMEVFEKHNEALSTATSAALYYVEPNSSNVIGADPDVLEGYPATGDANYSYIFSKPIDATHPELGDMIYVLDRGTGKTPQSLTQRILGEEVPLNVRFSISTTPVAVGKGEEITREDGTTTVPFTYGGGGDEYLTNTINVTISTSEAYDSPYTLSTSFTMYNFLQNQQVNYMNGMLCQSSNYAYIAGWTDENAKCPISMAETNRTQYATESANVLRYISAESFLSTYQNDVADFDAAGAGLCFGVLAMEGSPIATEVKGALRDFRDNVLAETALGQKVIDKYYQEWSPALIAAAEAHPALWKVGRAVLVPISAVALMLTA